MKKAFFVELSFSVVVMAKGESEAMRYAEDEIEYVVRDDPSMSLCSSAIKIKSIEHLKKIGAADWLNAIPYNSDSDDELKCLLPEQEPFVDTKTIDMFKDI